MYTNQTIQCLFLKHIMSLILSDEDPESLFMVKSIMIYMALCFVCVVYDAILILLLCAFFGLNHISYRQILMILIFFHVVRFASLHSMSE